MRPLVPLALTLLLAACGDGESLLPPDARLPDGGRYRGEVVNGLLQGQGRIDYPSGSWYAGQFDNGQWHGDGEWHGSNGEVYKGQFQQGLFHGQGTLTTHDSSYTGGFKLGRRNGEGTLKEAGMTYRGEFKDDQYSGLGHLELEDGSQYQGQFAHGKPNGEGQRSDSSGNQFTGRFVNGQLEGIGTFNSAEGDQYAGGFKHNQLNGKGRYENADGDVWIGEFKDGVLNGKGELIGVDGSHYRGEFSEWRFTGFGHLSLGDGSVYIGEFASDTYQGRGILTLADGSVQSGVWANGQRVRDADGKLLPDSLELGLLAQGSLLEKALAAVPASTPAIELYSLVLAGDGKQSVFLREADYVNKMLATRFGAYGQISLVNHRDHLVDRPMATRENLRRAAQTLAERSGPEDLIFIYLTSHGTHEHELVLDQPRLELADLPADEMASALAPLKNRDKIIVISACYSGGFIPALKDERTLIMTASRADRVSFGCSEEADFTYFGDALFAQALNQTDDLQQAFNLAKAHVADREQADNFEASEPQIWAPKGVLAHWQQLRKQQARKALQSASLDSKEAKSN
ncbi:C13 family peptidase [Pseudomonas gingeri]|uniref:Caspase family protein n=1 Tax=Pseudomonas gingeri TaxID=117681 RepID=A0A7Y7YC51_9PSED|nr:C13 family peptidase [Pseudomonas gingeri]NWA02838.1 caspase family protein [Pseudomonas gingeri]NWA17001.1 caspase family protein [Pseudomonas gingeri]NWA58452.1 caspase family protein [Pseudomonas gingeri]NWA97846.1 caspase family protein [Pseudomonas gingeri]NWB06070.1 caspase family protein [Pseudomonas gingeri]